MKKLFALFLAVAMALTVVACGKKTEDAAKDKIGTAETGMEFYIAIGEDGSKTVVDKSGAAAEGFTLDASGNIVDKGGQIIVAADKVQQLPTGETKPNENSELSNGSGDSSSVPSASGSTGSEAKNSTDSAGSGSSDNKAPSGTGGSGSSGNSGSSSSGGGNSGSTPTAPDPKPAHQHSWEPVYKTVEDYEMREIIYCVTCGQKLTGQQVVDHSYYHLERGESDQQREIYEQVKIGEHQEIDYYICPCGSTKAP